MDFNLFSSLLASKNISGAICLVVNFKLNAGCSYIIYYQQHRKKLKIYMTPQNPHFPTVWKLQIEVPLNEFWIECLLKGQKLPSWTLDINKASDFVIELLRFLIPSENNNESIFQIQHNIKSTLKQLCVFQFKKQSKNYKLLYQKDTCLSEPADLGV